MEWVPSEFAGVTGGYIRSSSIGCGDEFGFSPTYGKMPLKCLGKRVT